MKQLGLPFDPTPDEEVEHLLHALRSQRNALPSLANRLDRLINEYMSQQESQNAMERHHSE